MELLQDVLYAVLEVLLPILTAYLIRFLSKLFNKVKVETETTIVNNTISEVLDLVLTVVESTSQTYVDQLKKDGLFDAEAQKTAFNNTKEKITGLLSENAKNILSTLYGDIDAWLDVQIESTVRARKFNTLNVIEEVEDSGTSN